MSRQTAPIDIICVDDPPVSSAKDITWRFKQGLSRCMHKGASVIFIVEDDDWYSPEYVASVMAARAAAGNPEVFGVGYSVYYHIGVRAWASINHPDRASAFCTVIAAEAVDKILFGPDDEVFADIKIWRSPVTRSTFSPAKPIAVGIKHGQGVCGGIGHNSSWVGYNWRDPDLRKLRELVGEEDSEFYKTYSERL